MSEPRPADAGTIGGVPLKALQDTPVRNLEPDGTEVSRILFHRYGAGTPSTAKIAADRLGRLRRNGAVPELDAELKTVSKAKTPLGVQRHKGTVIPSMHWQEGLDLPDPQCAGALQLSREMMRAAH